MGALQIFRTAHADADMIKDDKSRRRHGQGRLDACLAIPYLKGRWQSVDNARDAPPSHDFTRRRPPYDPPGRHAVGRTPQATEVATRVCGCGNPRPRPIPRPCSRSSDVRAMTIQHQSSFNGQRLGHSHLSHLADVGPGEEVGHGVRVIALGSVPRS